MPRWRSTRRFHSNAGQLYECAFTRVQYGFHSAFGALVLSAFMDPTTALIGLAAEIAGSLLTLREPIACLGWYSLYICEVVFADCSREHFVGDETHKQFLVLVCAKHRHGHNHLGAAELVRHQLRGYWRPCCGIEHELCCRITCGLSHVLGYMNFWPTKFSWSLLHAHRGAGDSPTVTGSVFLHDVSDASCTNHLSVYH